MGPNHLGTSLMADLCQDINTVSSFSRCLNGISQLGHSCLNPNEKSNKYHSSLLKDLFEQRNTPSNRQLA